MIFDKESSPGPWLLARMLAHRLRNDSLLRNSIYIMGTAVITSLFGYLYWIVAVHLYSAHDIGLASALLNVMLLTSALADMGISSTLVQMLPCCKTDFAWSLTLNAGLSMGILSGLLAGIILVVALPLFSQQFAIVGHDAAYALVLIVGSPLCITATLLDQTFVAERAAGNMLVRNAAFAVFKLLLMVLPVLLAPVGALGIFSSYILAVMISMIGVSLLLVPRLGRAYYLTIRGMMGKIHTMFSSLAGHHLINIGGMAHIYLLPLFVTVRLSAVDNAYYYMTWMVSGCFFMVSHALATSLFAEGSHTTKALLHKVRFCAVIISILLGPILLTVFLGGRYILLLFGPSYAQHGLLLLRISTVVAVPDAITNIYVSMLRVQRRLRSAGLLNLGMASLTLALAWILLPRLGIAGVAWAALIAQGAGSLVAAVDVIFIRRHRSYLGGPSIESDSGSMKTEDSD